MSCDGTTAYVRDIMIDFADRTGISTTRNPPQRYLWTDAHAVCNFLSLYRRTGDERYQRLARVLIDQVHNVLGKHRDDDPRSGWISGLSEQDGVAHPTAGGLRIGKKLNERRPGDAYDERQEWDRDGQYFHYLTKWMHALCRAAIVTEEVNYCRWAMELAKAAHAGFAVTYSPAGQKRLLWKMSIDLSRALLPSTGQHDSLDALVTYAEIDNCSDRIHANSKQPDLKSESAEAAVMCRGQRWNTEDSLGIGGLLFDTCRVVQLMAALHWTHPRVPGELLRAALESLVSFGHQAPLSGTALSRLAFRELGLSIGLHAATISLGVVARQPELFAFRLKQDLETLAGYAPLGKSIERFWSQHGNQQVSTWLEHRDINSIVLATSLLPDEFLEV